MTLKNLLASCFAFILVPVNATYAAQYCLTTINSNYVIDAPDSRYQDNGDSTVTDLYTGLIWQQCSVGLSGTDCTTGSITTYTWADALQYAETLDFAGHTDWRVPNINELQSLADYYCSAPAINETLFPSTSFSTTNAINYWSSTPQGSYGNPLGSARTLSFYAGAMGTSANTGVSNYLRLVRAGQE